MKKDKRKIEQRRADKKFRRKVVSRNKIRKKNRNKIGYSKKFLSYQNTKKQYTKDSRAEIIAIPSAFSLIHNAEESINAINKIEKAYAKKKKVFVELAKVEHISYGAIVVLLSIMVKFKTNGLDFNGDFPRNKRAQKKLSDSGFFDFLYRDIKNSDDYSLGTKIHTHANKVTDPQKTAKLLSQMSSQMWGEEKTYPNIQSLLIELMTNTQNHASNEPGVNKHWWLSANYDKEKDVIFFSFIDYGVGILESINSKSEKNCFHKALKKLGLLLGGKQDIDILEKLLNGEVHKIIESFEKHRGKGLPFIKKMNEENFISNLKIITNGVFGNITCNKYEELRNKLNGTYVYWEIKRDNCIFENNS